MATIGKTLRRLSFAGLATTLLVAPASSQLFLFWDICHDPATEDPMSLDARISNWGAANNGILGCVIGLGGNFNYGPADVGCGPTLGGATHEAAGAIAFLSIAGSDINLDDDVVAITDGLSLNVNINPPFPIPLFLPSTECGYATIRSVDPADGTITDAKWGEDGPIQVGDPNASYRYQTFSATVDGGVRGQLKLRNLGTALRFEWVLTNLNATARSIGLRFCNDIRMRSGAEFTSQPTRRTPFMIGPNGRPNLIEQEWLRTTEPSFANEVSFYFSQQAPYPSIRFITDKDRRHTDQTRVDRFAIGNPGVLDNLWDFPIVPDLLRTSQYAMWFEPTTVQGNSTRTIVYYVEPAWARSDVAPPFTVATETSLLQAFSVGGTNGLDPNPHFIVAYVDNQFARIGHDIPFNADVTLELPPGITLVAGETEEKNTGQIDGNGVAVVRWQVEADGLTPGALKYALKVIPFTMSGQPLGNNMDINSSAPSLPGGHRYKLENTIMVSLTDRIRPKAGHNLVSFPWSFADPSFAAIGVGGATVRDWDAVSQGFVTATEAIRGRGQWLSYGADPGVLTLVGASAVGDEGQGNLDITLERGWNLIGNPYPYPIVLNQIDGRTPGDPDTAPWPDLVGRHLLRSTVFRWDADAASYKYSSDDRQILVPGVGYWVYSPSYQPVTLFFPKVFVPGLPNGVFTAQGGGNSPGKWTLPLSVSGRGETDLAAAIGVGNTRDAEMNSAPKPPANPYGRLQLLLLNGGAQMAQDIRPAANTVTFTAEVKGIAGARYTLTWPGQSEIPTGTTLRIRDVTSRETKNMRSSSSWAFTMPRSGSRKFTITAVTR